jgi:phenylpyruvate tautomerase PptA (4-oxalocrotonate tautomerase family)
MPVAYIDIPSGLTTNVKKQLVQEVAASIHHAYAIPDTRVFLREWAPEQTSVDGALSAAFRPIWTSSSRPACRPIANGSSSHA